MAVKVIDIENDYYPLSLPLTKATSLIIRQGRAIHETIGIKASDKTIDRFDTVTKKAIVNTKNFTITIEKYSQLASLNTFSHKILLYCLAIITARESSKFFFTLEEIMERFGLKDVKYAKRKIKNSLEAIYNVSLQGNETLKGEEIRFDACRILGGYSIDRRNFSGHFDTAFYENITSNYSTMSIDPEIFLIDEQKYLYALPMYYKARTQKRINREDIDADLISWEVLYQACLPYGLPSIEYVREHGRAYGKKIIEPMEKNLDALKKIFTWEYRNYKGELLTQEELDSTDINRHRTRKVFLKWTNDPEAEYLMKKLLEAEKRRKAIAAKEKRESRQISGIIAGYKKED